MPRLANPTTRLYQIKPGKSGWARIWLTNDGCFVCMSDYGNYSYWWGDPGCEFREFLTHLSGKFSGGKREYNGDRTMKVIQRKILTFRRENPHHRHFDRYAARGEWNRARAVLDDERGFEHWMNGIEKLDNSDDVFRDAWEYAWYGPPHQVGLFLKKIWPEFIGQLRAELAQEAEAGHLVAPGTASSSP